MDAKGTAGQADDHRNLWRGVGAPLLFGVLIKTNERWMVSGGYALGALLMLAGSLCESKIGVEAAGKSLESVSKPLQAK